MKVLIAEDDFTSRTALAGVLQREGHEVTTAEDGLVAWRELQQPDAPQLAILDWIMPEIDGLELVRRIRALPATERQAYLIMLTSKDQKADIVAALDAGANDYLPKPFDVNELRARISVGRRMIELQHQLAVKLEELRSALANVRALEGLIPICAGCKKVRDDKGYWTQLETYLQQHSRATISHCLCLDCLHKLYPDFAEAVQEKLKTDS